MKVSIISASYNREKSLWGSIKSALSQNFENVEYIVDGASKNSRLSIVNEYEGCVSKVVKVFESTPGTKLLLGAVDFVSDSNLEHVVRLCSSKAFSPWFMIFRKMPPYPATFINKDAYKKFGLYKLGYKICVVFEHLFRFLMVKNLKYIIVYEAFVVLRSFLKYQPFVIKYV